jgi:hypothetical protein
MRKTLGEFAEEIGLLARLKKHFASKIWAGFSDSTTQIVDRVVPVCGKLATCTAMRQ